MKSQTTIHFLTQILSTIDLNKSLVYNGRNKTSFEVNVYSRKIDEEPKSFVKNGKPVFGTFSGHPHRLDIRGVKNPFFTFPLPTFISNLKIKSHITYYFSLGEYLGYIMFFDAKITGLSQVCLWNTTTKQKYSYRTFLGPRRRLVPHDLDYASTACNIKKRRTRINWDRSADRLFISFDLKGKSGRPDASAKLLTKFSYQGTQELTEVCPFPTTRRCTAQYSLSSVVKGTISIKPQNQTEKTQEKTQGISLLSISRSYMKSSSSSHTMVAVGTIDGKPVTFRLSTSSQDAVDSDRYNTNVLFYDGKVTTLPPVVITHPFGLMSNWVVQDTENMIDLTFTPLSDNTDNMSFLLVKTENHNIYGTFEGTLMTGEGEKLSIRGLHGISKKYQIRL